MNRLKQALRWATHGGLCAVLAALGGECLGFDVSVALLPFGAACGAAMACWRTAFEIAVANWKGF